MNKQQASSSNKQKALYEQQTAGISSSSGLKPVRENIKTHRDSLVN